MIYVVTGHRPPRLNLDYSEESESFLANFCQDILKEIVDRESKLISGMANGWDAAMCRAAIALGVPVIAALPFQGQTASWPFDARQRWDTLLSKCAKVKIVSDGKPENYKYILRDKYMVDHGETVLTLWDGDKKGGTYETVSYAEKKSRVIVNYWDQWLLYSAEGR